MQFLYKGFRQNGNHRCYSFDAIEEDQPAKVCVIWVDLSLLTKYQVALQGGPEFCLQLLRGAALEGESGLEQFREYHAGDSDFASIVSERVARAAALAAKRPPRRFVRRPPASSHLRGVGYPAAAGKPQPEPVAPAKKPQKSR